MPVSFYLIAASVLPLAGFLLLIFFGRRISGLAGPVSTALALGSLAASVAALVVWVAKPEFNHAHYVEAVTFRWVSLPEAPPAPMPDAVRLFGESPPAAPMPAIAMGVFIDSLTVAMFVLVTLLSALVHLFSIASMAGDPRLPRFFAYLGLLVFGMLGLLLANSLVQFFAFWEIVGLAGTLLVAFWFEQRGPATWSLTSVLGHRFGDAAFIVGLGILIYHVGAGGLTFYDAQGTSPLVDSVRNMLGVRSTEFLYFTGSSAQGFMGLHWLTWAGLLMVGGAAARAAQFPLHTGFAAVAEAPPPAAAMLHGAASATGGIYLIARLYPILTMDARLAIAIIGCITLLVGALLALVQTDVRRLLAWSTVSQLGYIVLFFGTGGYTAGLLHLFAHAFFKAGLVLAAASVIHALGRQADLRQMGGLWRKLPLTAIGFGICALALIGVPFFSGAYSNQLGLAGAYEYAHALAPGNHPRAALLLFYVPALTAFITAFYMGRCWWLMFLGKPRNEELQEHVHESFLMILPIGILAALSVNLYELFGLPLILRSLPSTASAGPPIIRADQFLEGLVQQLGSRAGAYNWWAFLAVIPAVVIYWRGFGLAERLRRWPVLNLVYFGLRQNLFFDALYRGIFGGLTLLLARVAGFVDRFFVNGAGRLVALAVRVLSELAAFIDRRVIDGGVVDGTVKSALLANRSLVPRQRRKSGAHGESIK